MILRRCGLVLAGKLSFPKQVAFAACKSNSFCDSQTCRQRKLKCDEVSPACGQCRKASRECQPSTGLVFRHQQNASMKESGLGSFYAYKETFNENNVWVKVPKWGESFLLTLDMNRRLTCSCSDFSQYHRPLQYGIDSRTRIPKWPDLNKFAEFGGPPYRGLFPYDIRRCPRFGGALGGCDKQSRISAAFISRVAITRPRNCLTTLIE